MVNIWDSCHSGLIVQEVYLSTEVVLGGGMWQSSSVGGGIFLWRGFPWGVIANEE